MSDGRSRRAPRTGPRLLVGLEDEGWPALLGADPEGLARQAVFALADALELSPGIDTEISLSLAGDEDVRALNAEWRGKDRPTNVLSFPMRPLEPGERPGPLMGDLILARQTLAREAADEGKAPADHFRHLVVHGTLHLLGYDHEDDEAAEAMERLEAEILARMGIADPYAEAAGPVGGHEQDEERVTP